MKKYVFMAVLAIAAIGFVSCEKKNDEQSANAKIVLDQHALEVAVGGQDKLRVALDPAKDGVTVTFTSSDKEVATVSSSGLVSGVAAGKANIIASAEGYKSDTCVVTVIDAADAFAWGGMFVSRNEDYVILNDKDTIDEKLKDGTPVKCLLASGSGFAWDQNIFIDNTSETGLSGEGYITFLDNVPVLHIIDSIDENGPNYYYFGAGAVTFVDAKEFNDKDTAYAYCTPAGALGDPAQQLKYISDETGNEPSGVSGAEIWYMDAATFRGYPTVGLVGTGVLQGSTSEAYYKINISWFEEESMYGLKTVQDTEGTWAPKEPAEWAKTESKYYEKLPAASSARRLAPQAPNAKMEKMLKQLKKMKEDRMYKK